MLKSFSLLVIYQIAKRKNVVFQRKVDSQKILCGKMKSSSEYFVSIYWSFRKNLHQQSYKKYLWHQPMSLVEVNQANISLVVLKKKRGLLKLQHFLLIFRLNIRLKLFCTIVYGISLFCKTKIGQVVNELFIWCI